MFRGKRRHGQLIAATRRVAELDTPTRAAMWTLYRTYYTGAEEHRFAADLDGKEEVIIVCDAADGSLQGFTTLTSYRHEADGRRLRVLFSGDTIIAAPYQGQTALQRAFVRYLMLLVVRHPREEVYWFLISKGYKTYLLLSRNFLEYWPRHDRPTPRSAAAILASLGRARFGDAYRQETGIIRFDPPGPRLEAWVAPVEPAALERPDVRYFLERNPGWAEGDELCCIGRVDLAMGMNYLRRLVARRLRRARP